MSSRLAGKPHGSNLALGGLVLLLLLAALVLPPWLDDDVRRRVMAARTLRVGLDPAYPPFENTVAGALVGYDVDLARALGAQLGLEVVFVPMAYDGLYDALISGQVDVVLSSYPYSAELCGRERCTRPYFQAGQVLVVRAGSPIHGPDDLSGRAVAVEWGGPGDVLVRPWEAGGRIGRRVPLMSPREALAALAAGEVDAAVVDRISALTAGGPALVILEPPVQDESFVAVVAARAVWLHRQLDRALGRLQAEGVLEELEERWVGQFSIQFSVYPCLLIRLPSAYQASTLPPALGDQHRIDSGRAIRYNVRRTEPAR